MSRPHKIRRSVGLRGRRYKARPHPLFVLFVIVALGGLIYLGTLIYPPVHSAIMNWEAGRGVVQQPQLPGGGGAGEPEAPVTEQQVVTTSPAARVGNLRAVYAPPALLADRAAFSAFISGLTDAGLNAVMVDIKNADGQVLFASDNRNANDWEAVVPGAFDLGELSEQLAGEGLSLVVRMSAFRDEIAARGNNDYYVMFEGTEMRWLDNLPGVGRPWLNPHSEGARAYLTELALEAVGLGAVMVVLDDVQFPPNSLVQADFGDTGGLGRNARLAAFAEEFTGALAAVGARGAIYMPAINLASDEPNVTFFGGSPAEILSEYTVLGALPFQFPFGFESESLQLPNPTEDLSATLTQVIRAVGGQVLGSTIVLIQGGSLPGGVQYTDAQIRGQVETLAGLGINEFIFYATYVGHYQVGG